MKTLSARGAAWIEKKIEHLFTSSGLMTAVALILLSAFVLSGSGIERRTLDVPDTQMGRIATSPLLGNP